MEQTEALVNEHQEELLLKCGQCLPQEATNQQIKDAILQNHSNLRTASQCSNAYQQLQQKPDEALQTYNTRYTSYFNLIYPELEIDNPLSRIHCIHYASSLYGKLSDEMTGRFNQDLPENLHTAFKKATNFELRIITKQSINERRVHDINHIDVTSGQEEIEINEAHIRNPNYKGKNYDSNYQQNKNKNNFNNNSSTGTSYQNNGNQGQGNHYTKNTHQEKPVNVSVTLNRPVSKEQLYKIQEVLRHPLQYRDRLKLEDRPATGEYTKSFNKFCPKKVEVNEATVEEAIKFGQYLERSEEDIAEAIDIYKSLGNDTFHGPEEESTVEPQEQQDQ